MNEVDHPNNIADLEKLKKGIFDILHLTVGDYLWCKYTAERICDYLLADGERIFNRLIAEIDSAEVKND